MKKKDSIHTGTGRPGNSAANAQISPVLPPAGFVRLPVVLAVIPISRSAWWQGIKDGKYPKGVKFGPRTVAWSADSIRALIERMQAS